MNLITRKMENKVKVFFTANIERDDVAHLMKRFELEAVDISIDDVWAKISEKPLNIDFNNLDYDENKEFLLVVHGVIITQVLRELMKEGKGND